MSRLRIIASFAAVRWLRPLRSRAAVQRRQRRLTRRHLRFLRRRSAYFGELIPARGAVLSDLPLMDKALMMARFDDLNTVGLRREEAMGVALGNERSRDFSIDVGSNSVGLSSGTSGHRGLFVISRAEREAWAGTVLARTLPRGRIFGHRIALFLRADNTLYEAVRSRAVSFAYFDVFADMSANVDGLQGYRPSILVAPPSVLLVLARAIEQGRYDALPEKVYAVAEVLEEGDAARIAAAFGQERIHQLYQCTEGFLGHTCPHGTIHLNEDDVVVERESLGEGRFTPIVTDVRRRAQPIVRYRLGDVLRERAEPCPCGSALTAIERIEGREGDTLRLPGRNGGTVPVFADLVARTMIYAEGFQEYRVVQTGRAGLEVALDAEDGAARASVAAELGALADRMGCERPALDFVPFRHDGRQKLRRVVRLWRGDEGDEEL